MIRSCNHCGHLVADKTPAVCPSCGAPGTWTDCAEQRRRPRGRKIRFERITIRVTREEKAKLADAARLAGVALGAWLAELGMAEAAKAEPPRFRSVCAWCSRPKDGLGEVMPGERVSHGICADCEAKISSVGA